MKTSDINIRDPFVLEEDGKYYMYGTRAADFGFKPGGFDVYVSEDLENWDEPIQCFNSDEFDLNKGVNWAPEVHKYNGAYYMFATFTKENDLRGTYALKSDSPLGPFKPHSSGALTPYEWESLDGTLYVENGIPYLVFCHEHTQIEDGTVEYIQLSEDLTKAVSDPITIFKGSSPYFADEYDEEGKHYITDGPFMYKSTKGELFMVWSTFVKHQYSQCIAKSKSGSITGEFEHLKPLIVNGGGHGMIFKFNNQLTLTYHSPNETLFERPHFFPIKESLNTLEIIN